MYNLPTGALPGPAQVAGAQWKKIYKIELLCFLTKHFFKKIYVIWQISSLFFLMSNNASAIIDIVVDAHALR